MVETPLELHKGLWLWGNIGTGKSTMLEIIKDFCKIVRPKQNGWAYSFRINNVIDVCSDFSVGGYGAIKTYIDSNRQAFDEIGSETIPTGHYGTGENVMQYILQRRYDRRFSSFTHATSNISPGDIKQLYGARIYDRCREMFNFVEMRGKSFRH